MKRLREEKTENFITICSAQETLEKGGMGDISPYPRKKLVILDFFMKYVITDRAQCYKKLQG